MHNASTHFTLRPMAETDAAAVASLVRAAFAAQPVPVEPPPSALRLTEADVREHLRQGGGMVAIASAELAGSIMWAVQDGALHVARLAVLPGQRRQGIASALLHAAEQAARAAGLQRITLGTRLALTGNRHLFAAHGFVETTLQTHPGYTEPTWVELEKRLHSFHR
ncbi:MAG: GNAT family N-acetyltransferase [Acetobacteraceae bacterium]|nr:GNAT family N-acetyltransferase [Acetobacteraceae bacterium]